jgi:hypothetical protein
MKLEMLVDFAIMATTLREVDWVGRQMALYGERGIDALISGITDATAGTRAVLRMLSVLGSMHVVDTPKVAAAMERLLLTRPEVQLHKAVLPYIILHVQQGREDAALAVHSFKNRSEATAALVTEAYRILEQAR